MEVGFSNDTNKLRVTVYNDDEQSALVNSFPKFISYKVLDSVDDEDFDWPLGHNYPVTIEVPKKSLIKVKNNLNTLKTEPKNTAEAFGRIAVSTSLTDFFDRHQI